MTLALDEWIFHVLDSGFRLLNWERLMPNMAAVGSTCGEMVNDE